ncbi:MAG: hypothetical protein A3I11_04140 [Elusimicrobia bacterium RIFCSPLOWO2_02_FULL_39_32]|nr:MAG: hypothetical protein A2034_05500 [Elusimicrobia bacterium GWA2_38_7]OGR79564.1 MAG: hypothetical protein A3B80_02715 [Elusimicrobia bacterium RIFCSPHIGHO2_02_FULL_39_36]OGR92890.1 MAG: hypothetical protein A3I11_04140 [Elusimicrobia bacterium RIFCSPLOWO2_02_FULL_39_32]OGR99674.1 MAG: hypothetical protein A3G85_01505 [Elusimicrobia bacterium RIFCSPLOWO2_12_FULL_39_28]
MKVLYLHSQSALGGGETSLYALLSHLDRNQFFPVLVLPQDGPLAEMVRKLSIPVNVLNFPRRFLNRFPPGFSIKSFFQMYAIVREHKIDCIHVYDSYLILYGGLLSKLLGVPVILTAHGWWDSHFFYQDLLYKFFKVKICSVSKVVNDSILKRNWIDQKRASIIYLGIDTQRFKPLEPWKRNDLRRKMGLEDKEVVITIVGRFMLLKGFEDFFRSASIILESFQNVRFMVVGDKVFDSPYETDEMREKILNFFYCHKKISNKTLFTGFREDVELLLGISDILVSASWHESFGMAIVEGMSSALPVVSTNVGGPSETVLDGVTGFLVPPKNPELLSDRIMILIADIEKRLQMGKAARKLVCEKFSAEHYSGQIQEIYRTCCKAGEGVSSLPNEARI